MNYKITGTRKQFEVLFAAVGHYYTLYNGGDIRGVLNAVAFPAFDAKKEEFNLPEIRATHERAMIENIVNHVSDLIQKNKIDKESIIKGGVVIEKLYKTDLYFDAFNAYNDNFSSVAISSEELQLLSYICNTIMRFYCGQTFTMVDTLMNCWMRFHNDNTEEYYRVREEVKYDVELLHMLCWNQNVSENYGIHYNETVDILFDMHQVFRHALWKDLPEDKRRFFTVDSDEPKQSSDILLLSINKEKE